MAKSKVSTWAVVLSLAFFSVTAHAVEKEPAFESFHRRTVLFPYKFTQTPIPVAIFDADCTLRAMYQTTVAAHKPEQIMLLPFVAEKIQALVDQGYFVAVMSNQADIGRLYSFEEAESALAHTIKLLWQQGATVHYFDFAEFRDGDRKPAPGMGRRLEQFFQTNFSTSVDWGRSIMVGDAGWAKARDGKPADIRLDGREGFSHSNFDRVFAENLKIPYFEAADFFDWRKYGLDEFILPSDVKAFYQKFALQIPQQSCAEKLK